MCNLYSVPKGQAAVVEITHNQANARPNAMFSTAQFGIEVVSVRQNSVSET